MKKVLIFLILFLLGNSLLLQGDEKKNQKVLKPKIQIAILLDTSGSMDGLIDQAKTQLWKIVNTLATTKKKGRTPDLEVALYEYGQQTIPADKGYLRMILPLTNDLDKVSEELFKLKTNGGYEYCGRVIQEAVRDLKWSKNPEDYKAIFIAGNEPFTQGNIDYRIACKMAIQKGIIVNTIFCGSYQEGVQTGWKDGARLADGKYMNINQNQKLVHIPSPYDKKIEELGRTINKTYLPYGREGKLGKMRQKAQDKNAEKKKYAGAPIQRALAKANSAYRASWDLVEGVKKGQIKLEKIKKEDLPKEMQNMSLEEQKRYIEKLYQVRVQTRKTIQELNQKRRKYIAQKQREFSKKNTFDEALVQTLLEQLKKKKFVKEKK